MHQKTSHGEHRTAVIGGKAGAIDHKLVYTSFFHSRNVWNRLSRQSSDYSGTPQCCEFDRTGEYLAIGYDTGICEIWLFRSIPVFVCSLALSAELLLCSSFDIDSSSLSWGCSSLSWSFESDYLLISQSGKDTDRPIQGMAVLWNMKRKVATNVAHFSSPVNSVSFDYSNKNRCLVSLHNGDTWCIQSSQSDKRLIYSSEQFVLRDGKELKTATKNQVSKSIWNKDGNSAFIINASGSLKRLSMTSGECKVEVSVELNGAVISTLQLTDDSKHILVGASRGIYLLDTETLDLSSAQKFGEIVGLGGRSCRGYWTVGCIGNLSGMSNYPGKQTIFFSPNSKNYESREINWWVVGDPSQMNNHQVIDCPGERGVNTMVIHPHRPLMVAISSSGKVFMRKEFFQTDFAGPMYPVGYRLLNKNVYTDEAEDQFDIIVTKDEGGQESHRRLHEYHPPGSDNIIFTNEEQDGIVLDIGSLMKPLSASLFIESEGLIAFTNEGIEKSDYRNTESKRIEDGGIFKLLPSPPTSFEVETNEERHEKRKAAVKDLLPKLISLKRNRNAKINLSRAAAIRVKKKKGTESFVACSVQEGESIQIEEEGERIEPKYIEKEGDLSSTNIETTEELRSNKVGSIDDAE